MKTPNNNIFLLSLLFLFVHCSVKHTDKQLTPFSFPPAKSQTVNSFIGKWKCANIMFYSSELTLADNGIFTFHDRGCLGRKFSQGKWSNNNGQILLTSFDSFIEEKQSLNNQEISVQNKSKNNKSKSNLRFDPADLSYTTTSNFPGPNDTVKVYFHDIQMELKNDTLYCIGQNKFPERGIFYKEKTTD